VIARRVRGNTGVRFTRCRTNRGRIVQSRFILSPTKFLVRIEVILCDRCHQPEGAEGETTEPAVDQSSVEATRPPGEGEGAAGAGAGAAGGAGAGEEEGGPFTSLRFNSLRRGQLAGTCHGFSAQWQMGQIPMPAMARSQRVLIPFIE